MLKRFFFPFMLLVCLALPGQANESLIDFAEFDAYVEKSMQDWLVPGAAIAIVKDGKIVHLKTYGVRSLATKKPVTPDTIFYLASLTKGFTAAVISRLVDEGKIQWDDKVRKYFPDFKIADEQASAEFTIEDLLSHRSGLPGFAADSLVETGWAAKEVYQVLDKIPLKDPFRSVYNYQNIFPGIAGWIAAQVSGLPLSELYENYLFQPLHFSHTSIGQNGLTGGESWWTQLKKKINAYFADQTDQYCQLDGKPLDIPGGNNALYRFEASRGVNSSITDMAKWMIFQLNNGIEDGKSLISEANIQRMRTSHINVGAPQGGRLFPKERVKNIAYGMGWFIHDYDRLEVLGHMGGMTGTRSIIAIVPGEKVGIVVLSNMGGMRVSLFPEAIRSKFLDLYLKLPDQRDWSKELVIESQSSILKINQSRQSERLKNPTPERKAEAYVGAFHNDLYGTINVTSENGRLFINYRTLKVGLTHWNADDFSFQPNEFAKSYSGTDIGNATFYITKSVSGIETLLGVNLLQEGADKIFHRQSKGDANFR